MRYNKIYIIVNLEYIWLYENKAYVWNKLYLTDMIKYIEILINYDIILYL
jgi:hypothetical protein